MTKQMNMNPGATAKGGVGIGDLTAAGNPWTLPDGLADELFNRRLATYVTAAALQPTPVSTAGGKLYDGNGVEIPGLVSGGGTLGPYATLGAATAAIAALSPAPAAGTAVSVGASAPYALYDWNGSTLILSGGGTGLPVISGMVSLNLTTSATPITGAYVAFASQACTELRVTNRSGDSIEYIRGAGTKFISLLPGQSRRIAAISNANEISFRRSDWANADNPARTTVVEAMALTSTDVLTGAIIGNIGLGQNGANNLDPGACTAVEIINNSGRDVHYRSLATTQYIRLPHGSSAIVNDIVNMSNVQFMPFPGIADNSRLMMSEGFTTRLREPLKGPNPIDEINPNARVVMGEVQAALGNIKTPQNLMIGEIARGPRRTLVPKRVTALAQFLTAASINSNVSAQCADVSDGEIALGATSVEYTQVAGTNARFAPASVVATSVDCSTGQIRISISVPATTPNFQSGGASLEVQLHSAGTLAAPTGNYHKATIGVPSSKYKRIFTYSMHVSAFTAVGTGAAMNSILFGQFLLLASGSGTNGAKFRPISIDYIPPVLTKAIVIFSIDDFNIGAFTNLNTVLSKYGYPGVLFADPFTGISGVTPEQVRTLHQRYGWQVAGQNWRAETAQNESVELILQEQSKMNIYAQILGLNSIEDTSYGFNSNNNWRDDNMDGLRRIYRSATTFTQGNDSNPPFPFGETAPFGDPYQIRRLNMSSFSAGNIYNRWKDHVDQAIANKGVAFFGGHNEFNSGTGENMTAITSLVDYIKSQEVLGLVEVLTLDDAISKIYPR